MEKKRTYEELEKRILELEGQRRDGGNREYKSRLFCFIFGREENKQWTLSLYNAIHGSSYDDPSSITINTIEDGIHGYEERPVHPCIRQCQLLQIHGTV